MSTKNLEKILTQFGLEGKRATVYLALLQLGKVPVQHIAKTAGVKRTTAYSILKLLEEDGLVVRAVFGKKTIFVAEDPEKLQSTLRNKEKLLEKMLPELRLLYNLIPAKPRVQFYEGLEGIKTVFEDTLFEKPKEILAFSSLDDLTQLLPDYIRQYAVRKAESKIPLRGIVMDTSGARRYATTHYKNKNAAPEVVPQIRFVPKDKFVFKNEINIYGNKVAIISLKEEELLGIIIESAVVADTWRAIFELAWDGAGKYN
jgi:sugar-specific transcriptional regulator TrmB